jgi:hypothetical protein
LIDRQGKKAVLYAGLLDAAHQEGLKEIRTSIVQIPCDENGHVAICQSTVITEKGTFSEIGDASPQNVARPMLTCLLRMAATRSKARALRDAVNVGVISLEEMDEEEPARPKPAAQAAPPPARSQNNQANQAPRPAQAQPARPVQQQTQGQQPAQNPAQPQAGSPDDATPAQLRMIEALAGQTGQEVNVLTLSRKDASTLITELKAVLAEKG